MKRAHIYSANTELVDEAATTVFCCLNIAHFAIKKNVFFANNRFALSIYLVCEASDSYGLGLFILKITNTKYILDGSPALTWGIWSTTHESMNVAMRTGHCQAKMISRNGEATYIG